MIAVGEHTGRVVVFGSGDDYEETIPLTQTGPFRRVVQVGKKTFVVGGNGVAWVRDGRDQWREISYKSDPLVLFESVDGFSPDEVYAVGWDGALLQHNGETWSALASPTQLILSDACCAEDGIVYACGQVGTLVRGRGTDWQAIDTGIKDDLWNLAFFNGRLYVASFRGVFALGEQGLEGVHTGAYTHFDLSVGDGVMWSIGAKDIMATDGDKWWRIA